jgi:NAD(P)-dependent dehydrogenase (short-subunit alcohol dehydrogenase family)
MAVTTGGWSVIQFDFSEKVFLVTGGTSGIGRAAALAFARSGAQVALCGRRREEGEETAHLVEQEGSRALFVRSDISRESDVSALIEAVMSEFGRLDCAFNNAGIEGHPAPLHEQSSDLFDELMAVNVRGVFLSMKHEINVMLRQGGGAIVNNSSVAGIVGFPSSAPYAASKHAVMGLTRAAALDYATHNIRINAVNPGPIETDMIRRFGSAMWDNEQEALEALQALTPMGRMGRADEIANVVLFLCSEAGSYITGQSVAADGGMIAG